MGSVNQSQESKKSTSRGGLSLSLKVVDAFRASVRAWDRLDSM